MWFLGFHQKNPVSDPGSFQFCWSVSSTFTESVSAPLLSSHGTSPSSTPLPQFLGAVPLLPASPAWSSGLTYSTASLCRSPQISGSCPGELTLLPPVGRPSRETHLWIPSPRRLFQTFSTGPIPTPSLHLFISFILGTCHMPGTI